MPTSAWGRARTRPGILCCLILGLLLSPHALLARTIMLGEVNWAGSSRSTADEWLEIWNTGADVHSLDGWSLEGASEEALVFDATHRILPQQAFLIANYPSESTKSALAQAPDLITSAVHLSNDGFHLILKDDNGTTEDELNTAGKPSIGSSQPSTSMVRTSENTEIELELVWKNADTSRNLEEEENNLGTPGICDGCLLSSSPSPTSVIDASNSYVNQPLPESFWEITTTTTATTSTDNLEESHTTSSDVNLGFTSTTWTNETESASSTTPSLSASSTEMNEVPTSWESYSGTSSTPSLSGTTSTLFATSTQISATSSTPLPVLPTSSEEDGKDTTTTLEQVTSTLTYTTSSAIQQSAREEICLWRLKTIFPAPSQGPEWVEISGCENPDTLRDWSIHDEQGEVLHVRSDTPLIYNKENESVRVSLTDPHLRNTGEVVTLKDPTGTARDQVSYPQLQHDEHYNYGDDGRWSIPERVKPPSYPTTTLEPNEVTTVSSALTSKPYPAVTKTATKQVVAASQTPSNQKKTKVESYAYGEGPVNQAPTKKPGKTTAQKPKSTAVAKKTPKKSTPMTTAALTPRVYLRGTVGTPPEFVGKRRFILLNHEGRGLLIQSNGKQPSPALGTSVEVSGTLITDDDGTHLAMRAQDSWRALPQPLPTPPITTVNLEHMGGEQNWSLVELEGEVKESKPGRLTITVEDLDIQVYIHRSLPYRATRFEKHDVVHIRGVIDLTQETPRAYPRLTEEIYLVKRTALPVSTAQTHHSLPPWAPVSAAGTTIATAYSLRRLRAWYAQKQLNARLTMAVKELSSPS